MVGQLELWTQRLKDRLQLKGFAVRTIENYVGELPSLLGFLEGQGIRQLSQVLPLHLEAYRTHLFYLEHRGRRLTLGTQSRRLSAVKTFFRLMARAGYLLVDPAAALELPKTPETLPRTLLNEKEMDRLLQACNVHEPLGLRDRAILETLYGSAVRNSELLALTLDDVEMVRGEVWVRCGKGGKSRVVPLGAQALAWVETYLDRSRPFLVRSEAERHLFLSARGQQLGRRWLSFIVQHAGQRAGLAQRVTPHALRHACVTHMLRRGARIRHLQTMLGHACLNSTQRYTRVEIVDLQRMHRKFHPRER
ncbi:MAG: tyrosine-type recombinase/integrase [Chloroflexi bacterium]|nr:tyrosine-type recombinase/integrase [Chloroflexota bacterium]